MTYQLLAALITFAFVTSVTPGPNNLMLMASGANFGFGPTLPHLFGVTLGHSLMVFLVGLGLGEVFQAYPPAKTALKVVSVAYMLWLAWKIAQSAAPGDGKTSARPMRFSEAAAFQWVNPKGWAMALGAVSAYAPAGSITGLVIVAVVFASVNLPSCIIWVRAGQELRRVLTNPVRLRVFNWTMAVLLVASLWPVITM